ncbi:sorting nexin-8-like isoform X2 [Topomyia yanbarensis]|uniref:sorting nexin-8-like isoform X2 n=1 Tax=Topomyia yanbarensis TaxID=2498891 RepID=UPI00273BFF37|nr:sorting nexin-8-like isoform X2 [Topomyia yanbarensis]
MSVMVESSPVAMVTISCSTLTNDQQHPEDMVRISDSRFDSNLSPVSGLDLSRSPSCGDTFMSAATDGPLSSSDSECSGDEEIQLDAAGLAARSPSLNTNHNSATAFDHVPSLPMENGVGGLRAMSPGEGPSGSSSISLSMGSMGEDLGERRPCEPIIVVTVIPEKKGIFLKHSEYEIKARAYDTVVRRRYKDFVALFSYLVEKYPYRIIPSLPPKQLLPDSLLEARRGGLQTWLTILTMHPVLGSSPILITFLSDRTPDYQYRMRVMYEKQMDEFSRLREDVDLPLEDLKPLAASRDSLRKVLQSLMRLRKIFDEQTSRAEQQARDMAEVDLILQGLDVRNVFEEKTFEEISHSAQKVARHSETYVQLQRNAVNERIHVLMEVLAAHSDLCERVEKGILADYQKALSKSHVADKMKIRSIERGSASNPAHREEADLSERRCAFALQCVRSETSLTEKYLSSLPSILISYANEESQYHSKMSKIWHQLVANETSKLC